VLNALDHHCVLGSDNQYNSAPITLSDPVDLAGKRQRPRVNSKRIGGKLGKLSQQRGRIASWHLLRLHRLCCDWRYDQLHRWVVALSDNSVKLVVLPSGIAARAALS
jgi:hypothetical protein